MKTFTSLALCRSCTRGLLLALALAALDVAAQTGATNGIIVEVENEVLVLRSGSTTWDPARSGQPLFSGDEVRTGARSRALVRLSNNTPKRIGPRSRWRIDADEGGVLHYLRGALYYFHRDKPGTLPVRTPTSFAVVRGTEFYLHVADDGTTTLALFDGEVEMQTPNGNVTLRSGEQVIAARGKPPRKERLASTAPMLAATNLIQWVLYYPAVLNPDDLRLTEAESSALADSLRSYRAGDVRDALTKYPADRLGNASGAERVFYAALLLSVGEIAEARELLASIPRAANQHETRLAVALERMIDAIQQRPKGPDVKLGADAFSTEWLSESYVRQSQRDLNAARDAARRATEIAPQFGFAWGRLAELEFSFRRVPQARQALARSVELAARNAQSHALQVSSPRRTMTSMRPFTLSMKRSR